MTKQAIIRALAPATLLCAVGVTHAQEQPAGQLEEIIVTASKREENLQQVPVAITALNAEAIERAGVNKLADFIALTPNVMLRDSSQRTGEVYITVRGVTTTQNGWSPVTYTVDGVQATSIDAINQGVLTDVERIEILKGPQGVLYGAGAIAGAINVITKKPTNETEYAVKTSYGNGEDFRASAAVSGPIVADTVLFRIGAYHRDFGGLIEDTDGEPLDFDRISKVSGRLLFELGALSIDLGGSYADAHSGAVTQQRISDVALQDVFNDATRPRRGIRGFEDRTYKDVSARLDWEMGFATLTSVTGYSKIDQHLYGTASFDKPPTTSAFGPLGDANNPFADGFQNNSNRFESFTQDLRLASGVDAAFRWLLGASYVDREAVDLANVGVLLVPALDRLDMFFRPDVRNDAAWGAYGEVNYDVTDKLTLTAGARYDENRHDSTQYSDLTLQTPVPTADGTVTLRSTDSKWQPKLVMTYQWTEDVMSYASYTEGFRFGFYNFGNETRPESVENYEVGLKTTLVGGTLRLNTAVFHEKYSDQQRNILIAEPPFKITDNIPEQTFDGLEVEIAAILGAGFDVSAGIGYLEADGEMPTYISKHSVNLAINHRMQLAPDWEWRSRADYRRVGSYTTSLDDVPYTMMASDEVNVSTSLTRGRWSAGLFAKNVFDHRQATDLFVFGPILGRMVNAPRAYYLELSYRY